jgi:DNA-binding transcriptional MerR regulator
VAAVAGGEESDGGPARLDVLESLDFTARLLRRRGGDAVALCEVGRCLRPARALNGYREYTDGDVTVVKTIRTMYEIGFSREAVAEVLPCAAGDAEDVDAIAVRTRVESMCDELGARIEDLRRTRALLVDFLHETATTGCSVDGTAAWSTTRAGAIRP